jgi:hypothetical protein
VGVHCIEPVKLTVGPGAVLSQQAVSVFIGAALPGALRITEVDVHFRVHREALVFSHLQASVPSQRAPQGRGQFTNLPAQCGDDGGCVFAGHFDQDLADAATDSGQEPFYGGAGCFPLGLILRLSL